MSRGIIKKPAIGNSSMADCGRVLAYSQGGDTSTMTALITDFIGDKANNHIQELTGGKLGKLGDGIDAILNDNNKYIKNIETADVFMQWQNSINSLETNKIKTIVAARNALCGEPCNSTSNWMNYLKSEISMDLSGMVNEIDTYLIETSINFENINLIYKEITDSKKILNNLIEMKQNTLVDIVAKINQYQKEYNVDVRKNLYDYERIELYNNIFNVLKIIYYVIFVIYINFGNFMKFKLYKQIGFYFVATIYLLFPFTLKYIFAAIIYLYELTLKFFGVEKKIYSYSDIIRASNLDTIFTSPVPGLLDARNIENNYIEFLSNHKKLSI